MTLPIAILAGGLATRMRPHTEHIPKSLLPVAGEPFIFHQLRLLRLHGIGKVVLCVGYLGEKIQEVVEDGARFGLEVHYSFDGEKLLGTGGALFRALPQLGQEFMVLYGDSYLQIDYQAVAQAYRTSGKPALMTVLKNEGRWDASNVHFEPGKQLVYDKKNPKPEMRYVDYGLSVFSDTLFVKRTSGEAWDLSDFLSELSKDNRLAGYEVLDRFYEIGSPRGLEETDMMLRKRMESSYDQLCR